MNACIKSDNRVRKANAVRTIDNLYDANIS